MAHKEAILDICLANVFMHLKQFCSADKSYKGLFT